MGNLAFLENLFAQCDEIYSAHLAFTDPVVVSTTVMATQGDGSAVVAFPDLIYAPAPVKLEPFVTQVGPASLAGSVATAVSSVQGINKVALTVGFNSKALEPIGLSLVFLMAGGVVVSSAGIGPLFKGLEVDNDVLNLTGSSLTNGGSPAQYLISFSIPVWSRLNHLPPPNRGPGDASSRASRGSDTRAGGGAGARRPPEGLFRVVRCASSISRGARRTSGREGLTPPPRLRVPRWSKPSSPRPRRRRRA
jgi:hypothetical protein